MWKRVETVSAAHPFKNEVLAPRRGPDMILLIKYAIVILALVKQILALVQVLDVIR
jgi:hypothetical protein